MSPSRWWIDPRARIGDSAIARTLEPGRDVGGIPPRCGHRVEGLFDATSLGDYSRGIFTLGVRHFGLAEDGVDIAYSGGFIDHIRPQIEDLRAQIIAGDVVVPSKPAKA